MEVSKTSRYSVAESFMIMCITRRADCTPSKCLKCGWLRDDVRESLNERVLEEMEFGDRGMKAYFAHPMSMYNTQEAVEIFKVLKEKGWRVVSPSDYCSEAKKLTLQAGGGWLSCEVCRGKVMKPLFYRLLGECDIVVCWNPSGTCGVECEMVEAKRLGKIIYDVVVENGRVLVG